MTPTINRRSFLRSSGAALLASAALPHWPSEAAAALGGTNVQIVDTGHGTNPAFLRPLADNGVQTIFRYYAQENNIPGKNITPYERDMTFDHGASAHDRLSASGLSSRPIHRGIRPRRH